MEKKEENKGFLVKESGDNLNCKFIITSKAVKHSKLELAWRVGITVAVIALICLSV